MISLPESSRAWNSPDFDGVLKVEVGNLGVDQLPLQQGLSSSSIALDHDLDVVILHKQEAGGTVVIKAGIFYFGVEAGCSCADDPTPTQEQNEYCEFLIQIDLANGDASVTLSGD
jgi:hypothetical protein